MVMKERRVLKTERNWLRERDREIEKKEKGREGVEPNSSGERKKNRLLW